MAIAQALNPWQRSSFTTAEVGVVSLADIAQEDMSYLNDLDTVSLRPTRRREMLGSRLDRGQVQGGAAGFSGLTPVPSANPHCDASLKPTSHLQPCIHGLEGTARLSSRERLWMLDAWPKTPPNSGDGVPQSFALKGHLDSLLSFLPFRLSVITVASACLENPQTLPTLQGTVK